MKRKIFAFVLLNACLITLTSCAGVADNTSDSSEDNISVASDYEVIHYDTNQANASTAVSADASSVASVEETIVSYSHDAIAATKNITFNGKQLSLTFSEIEKDNGVNRHQKNIYTTADGIKVGFDSITDKLVSYSDIRDSVCAVQTEVVIREKEALKMANALLKSQFEDASDYTLKNCYYNEQFGYNISYSRYIAGYSSNDAVTISITNSGVLQSFHCNPYAFEGYDTSKFSIDKESILKRVENNIANRKNSENVVNYEIGDMRLATQSNGKVYMEVKERIIYKSSDGNEHSSSSVGLYELSNEELY